MESPLGSTTTFDVGLLGRGGSLLVDGVGAVAGGVSGGGGAGAVIARDRTAYYCYIHCYTCIT